MIDGVLSLAATSVALLESSRTPVALASTSIVTVYVEPAEVIQAMSLGPGVAPPVHFVPSLQFPEVADSHETVHADGLAGGGPTGFGPDR
ncbi:MAG: hypothetical protein ACRDJI_08810 [Actinomycetota bacterium]